MIKEKPLKARGIRFRHGHWERLEKLAKRFVKSSKEPSIRASDLVREAIDDYLKKHDG